jgi:glutaredoxin
VGHPTGSGIGKTHGTVSTYSIGCRCVDCKAAKRLWSRQNTAQQVAKKQRTLAAVWVRENMPHRWMLLRLQAEEEIEAKSAAAAVVERPQ